MILKEIPKGIPTKVSEHQFRAVLAARGSSALSDQYHSLEKPSANSMGYIVLIGDVLNTDFLQPIGGYMLVIGHIKTRTLSMKDPFDGDLRALIVIGDVECDYLTHAPAKSIYIDGNLLVHKIVHTAFDQAKMIVIKDFDTTFYFGHKAQVLIGGNIVMNYGIGFAMQLTTSDRLGNHIFPKHSAKEAAEYLGLNPDVMINRDLIHHFSEKNNIFNYE